MCSSLPLRSLPYHERSADFLLFSSCSRSRYSPSARSKVSSFRQARSCLEQGNDLLLHGDASNFYFSLMNEQVDFAAYAKVGQIDARF